MAKRQRLTLLQVLDEIFIDPPSEDGVEVHLEEDYNDSEEYLPEIDKEVPNEVTDTHTEPVTSTSNFLFSFHQTTLARLCGGRGRVPGSFALFSLCHF